MEETVFSRQMFADSDEKAGVALMGFVDISLPQISSSPLRTAVKASLDDGVDYGRSGLSDGEEKAEVIKNMWSRNGVLTSRKKLDDVGFISVEGDYHSSASCFGGEFVHAGDGLYFISEEGCSLLYKGIPDSHSFLAEFSGRLYLYCEIYVFSVDRKLNVKEEMPYCPVIEGKCDRETGIVAYVDRVTPNIIAPVARAYYGSLSPAEGKYHFPLIMDCTKRFLVYVNDELVDESKYAVDGNYFILDKGARPDDDGSVSICFYSDNEHFNVCGIIGGCSVAAVYGSGFASGTRVICAGNPEHCGKYFLSELSNPLYFKENDYGIVGNGSEDIISFSMQQSELLIFTENTVSRMRYNYTSENGGYYSVHLVNPSIGCDIKGSVVSAENRTFFANSRRGVFVVDSTDGFDVLNVLPVSANINDCTGKNGFFSVGIEERIKGSAVFFDRKYMLHMGESVFILDFGKKNFSYGIGDEKKLSWFEFDGFEAVSLLFDNGSSLFALKDTADGMRVMKLDGDGRTAECVYRSADSNLGFPFTDKQLYSFKFEFTGKNAVFDTAFYADGTLFYRVSARPDTDADGFGCFSTRLPKFSARHFAFEIKTHTADVGIMNVGIDYKLCKKTGI